MKWSIATGPWRVVSPHWVIHRVITCQWEASWWGLGSIARLSHLCCINRVIQLTFRFSRITIVASTRLESEGIKICWREGREEMNWEYLIYVTGAIVELWRWLPDPWELNLWSKILNILKIMTKDLAIMTQNLWFYTCNLLLLFSFNKTKFS